MKLASFSTSLLLLAYGATLLQHVVSAFLGLWRSMSNVEHFATSGCAVTRAWDLWFVHVSSKHPSSIWGVKVRIGKEIVTLKRALSDCVKNWLPVLSYWQYEEVPARYWPPCGKTCVDETGRGMRAKTSSTESEARASCGWQYECLLLDNDSLESELSIVFSPCNISTTIQMRWAVDCQSTLAVEWAALCWLRTTVWANEAFCCKSRTAQKASS